MDERRARARIPCLGDRLRASELANLKTVEELKRSKFWPLVKAAMEEEINGKMLNGSWETFNELANN